MKKFLAYTGILWVVLFVLSFVVGLDLTPFQRVGGTLVFSAVIILWIAAGCPVVESNKPRETGISSCRKCGFLGVAYGSCPRCGSTMVDKITTETKVISCRKCGFLGAGFGTCPRCGSTVVDVVKK